MDFFFQGKGLLIGLDWIYNRDDTLSGWFYLSVCRSNYTFLCVCVCFFFPFLSLLEVWNWNKFETVNGDFSNLNLNLNLNLTAGSVSSFPCKRWSIRLILIYTKEVSGKVNSSFFFFDGWFIFLIGFFSVLSYFLFLFSLLLFLYLIEKTSRKMN